MRHAMGWLACLASVLGWAASSQAGDVLPTQFRVREKTTGEMVTFRGKLKAPRDLESPASVEFHAGTFTETVPAASLVLRKNTLSYKAAKGTQGVVQFFLSTRSGAFRLTAKDVAVGSLDAPVAVTVDVGGERMTALFPLKGARTTHSWRKGQPLQGIVKGRVLRVGHALGNEVLTPVSGTTFVRNDAEEPEALVVDPDPVQTDLDGRFTVTIEYTDPAVPSRLDLAYLLGQEDGLTSPGRAAAMHGDSGELEVAVFLQRRSEAGATLTPSVPETLEVLGSGGAPSGTLTVPAGAVASSVAGVVFTPYSMPVELPAPLPEDYVAVAGAEVKAPTAATFVADSAPTVEISRPRWAEKGSLGPAADIRLLQYRNGRWEERPGRGKYDAVKDRLVPHETDPATLAETGPVVYAVKLAPGQGRRLRGRVVDKDGNPIRGRAVLSRTGGIVSGSGGAFGVPRSAVSSSALEVVQVVGQGTSTARVVASSEASGEGGVTVQVAEEAPQVWALGLIQGDVYGSDGTTPSPGATVTFSLAGAVTGLTHDDGGTTADFSDDTFAVPDLSDFGVTTFEWALRFPGSTTEFVSQDFTGTSANPFLLILEAQAAGSTVVEGGYTVRVGYTVASLGDFSLYGGFRLDFDGIEPVVSDVQLPASFESTASVTATANVSGHYQKGLYAPLGIPMVATAVSADGASSGTATFQYAASLEVDVTFDGVAPPPPPPPGAYSWTTKASMPTARYGCGVAVLNGKVYVAGGSPGAPAVSTFEVYDPATNSWSTLPSMSQVRFSPFVAAVGGLLYAIGGADASGALATVEAYDPVSNSWSPKASLGTAQYYAAGGVVSGKIYVCGGTSTGPHIATVQMYDPVANSWTTKASLPEARQLAGGAVVNGVLYFFGGTGNNGFPVSSVFAYDPGTDSWTTKASMATARNQFGAGVINGEIFAVGGSPDGGILLSSVEIYNPTADTWRAGASMPTPRRFLSASVAGSTLYAIGGYGVASLNTVEAYGPAPYSWTTKASSLTARYKPGVAALNGKVYMAGGGVFSGSWSYLSSLEVYDPSTNSWASLASMSTVRLNHGCVATGGLLYAIGGTVEWGSAPLSSVEAYDPVTNSWSGKAAMPTARSYTEGGLAVVNGKILVCGGRNASGALATVEEYDPQANTWATRQSMPASRYVSAAAVVNGVLYIIGGARDEVYGGAVDAYDPASDSWTTRASMPTARAQAACAVIAGEIYVVGGHNANQTVTYSTLEIYNPSTDTWRTGTSMPTARFACGGAVVNGVLYVVGGFLSGPGPSSAVVEAYGPE